MAVIFRFDAKKLDLEGNLKRGRAEMRLFIAAQMQTNRAMLFQKGGANNGHDAWKQPLFRKGQPLKASGALAQSMGPNVGENAKRPQVNKGGIVRIQGNKIEIGSNLIYAAMMNFGTAGLPGGVLRPVNARALAIPLPGGRGATKAGKNARKQHGGTMFVQSVKIPPRRFDEWTEQDLDELAEAYANKLVEMILK